MNQRSEVFPLVPQPVAQPVEAPAQCPATWHSPRWERRPGDDPDIRRNLDRIMKFRTYPQAVKDAINRLLNLLRR